MKKLTIVLFSTILMAACSSENISEQRTLNNGNVCFTPQMASDWNAPWTTRAEAEANTTVQTLQGAEGLYLHTNVQRGIQTATATRQYDITRGGIYTGNDDGNGHITFATTETFRVSGYRYASNSNVSTVAAPNFLNNAEVQYVSQQWKAAQEYVMPAATDLIDFFAWFVPTGTSGVTANNGAGGTQLTYTVPADIDEQPDLLAAVTRNESYDPRESYRVGLEFTHQLTAINFELDENVAPGSISEIAFLKVYTSATLPIGGSWDTTQGTAPAATSFDVNFPTVANNAIQEGVNIIGPLMMIPQDFTESDQQIRIQILIDGESEPRLLYADLKDTKWEPNTTVTYKISTSAVNVLRISGVTYPTSWSTASTENSDIKSTYANGDEIGVYAVDAEGNVVYTNKKYTLTSGNWVSEDATQSLYVPGCTYYAYYPYQSSGLASAPEVNTSVLVNSALPTAAQFFAEAVTNWTPAANQSTAAALNLQDLQIGQSTSGAVSTVSFTMAHTMGLTSLTLESKNVPTTRYYEVLANGTTSSTSYIDSDDETSITPSDNFAASNVDGLDNTKMLNNGTVYYYIQNPSATTPVIPVVSSSTTGIPQWEETSVTLTPTAGSYNKHQATVHRDHVYKGLYYTYRTTETSQSFTPEVNGTYTIECWGAAGGSCSNGGYTYGEIELATTNNLFIYTGKQGDPWSGNTHYNPAASFNGGGAGANSSYYSSEYAASSAYVAASGGGATDVRTYNSGTSWANFTGLLSRIMVAAGGGGQGYGASTAGAGGGINGLSSSKSGGSQGTLRGCSGASQIAGGTTTSGFYSGSGDWTMGVNGSFGRGANGVVQVHAGAGGGGGYFGGASGAGGGGSVGGVSGSGGSSFISGMTGCQAYESSSTSSNLIKRTGDNTAIHHSGLKFNSSTAITINGASLMPRPTGGTETGHAGNGYCRIKTPVVD